jgi:hypothetical protein
MNWRIRLRCAWRRLTRRPCKTEGQNENLLPKGETLVDDNQGKMEDDEAEILTEMSRRAAEEKNIQHIGTVIGFSAPLSPEKISYIEFLILPYVSAFRMNCGDIFESEGHYKDVSIEAYFEWILKFRTLTEEDKNDATRIYFALTKVLCPTMNPNIQGDSYAIMEDAFVKAVHQYWMEDAKEREAVEIPERISKSGATERAAIRNYFLASRPYKVRNAGVKKRTRTH